MPCKSISQKNKFYDYFIEIVKKKLDERDTITKVIERIKDNSKKGKIAFYPCSKFARTITNEIRNKEPEILNKIIGYFDKSKDAVAEKGIKVYQLEELSKFEDEISLLVIASNNFYEGYEKEVRSIGKYKGKLLKISEFDTFIPEELMSSEIISKIKEVYDLLADEKSRITYMIAWLSRLLKDEEVTYLFESSNKDYDNASAMVYRDYTIEGLNHPIMKEELELEIYRMKYVYPEKGDVVFDLGAYVGDTSVFFAHYVGEGGKVYAFEPVEINYGILLKNIKNNKLDKVIVPVKKGLSGKNGFLKAVFGKSNAHWSYLSSELEGGEVEVTTIDSFVKSNKIGKLDYIKMDIEGLEYGVINGAKIAIKNLKPKLAVALYHHTTDLFSIPLLINEIADYKLYLRSKIEGAFGLTLFGLPK